MRKYGLYLESGPRQRKTMVHVLALLGCIAQGPTTAAALENTPEAIRAYLRFLHRHGEAVKPREKFSVTIAAHVMEGGWVGNGDPATGFAPDFQPLSNKDLNLYLQRLMWLRADLLKSIRHLPQKQLIAKPAASRSIHGILDHVAGSGCVYLRYLVGKVDGLSDAMRAVESSPDDLPAALTRLWKISSARLQALTAAERKQLVKHGQVTWTARRAFRRLLEHDWEHLQEISERLSRANR
jgi:predicted RNase H-like HicB family nuclease